MSLKLGAIGRLSGFGLVLLALSSGFVGAAWADGTAVSLTIDDWARVSITPPATLTSGDWGVAVVRAQANFRFVLSAYWQSTTLEPATSAEIYAAGIVGPHAPLLLHEIPFNVRMTLSSDGVVSPTSGSGTPLASGTAAVGINPANRGTIAVTLSKAP